MISNGHRDIAREKEKIRDRYKGVNKDNIEVIPAAPTENFHDNNSEKRVAVYADVIIGINPGSPENTGVSLI